MAGAPVALPLDGAGIVDGAETRAQSRRRSSRHRLQVIYLEGQGKRRASYLFRLVPADLSCCFLLLPLPDLAARGTVSKGNTDEGTAEVAGLCVDAKVNGEREGERSPNSLPTPS